MELLNTRLKIKKKFFLLLVLSVSCCYVNAQTNTGMAHLKKIYKGIWLNKKDNRYLSFSFDTDVSYITINDWTGSVDRNKSDALDAYRAYIKNGKLVIPAEDKDHHAPYCEIEIAEGELIYQCNASSNYTDSVLIKNHLSTTTIFKRIRK